MPMNEERVTEIIEDLLINNSRIWEIAQEVVHESFTKLEAQLKSLKQEIERIWNTIREMREVHNLW